MAVTGRILSDWACPCQAKLIFTKTHHSPYYNVTDIDQRSYNIIIIFAWSVSRSSIAVTVNGVRVSPGNLSMDGSFYCIKFLIISRGRTYVEVSVSSWYVRQFFKIIFLKWDGENCSKNKINLSNFITGV